MIKIVDFEEAHLESLRLKAVYQGETSSDPMMSNPKSITLFHGEQPVAVIGGYFITAGVMQVWALVSEDVKKCPIGFHRACKFMLGFWFEKAKLRRMQMTVKFGFLEGWHWAESLGFQCEGVLKRYRADGDVWMFARTVGVVHDGH